ncbi:adenosylcobinamide-GDP ribazoletransferase [Croceicoccus naphthovorans]|uniref:Adenosylcobinamide-GDP ribazoletransferase n=1 Tax=Croceicoccus naphthovorans TaxID=1348774 RepID=A0A0G3XHV8_9SPHN|nr:adenosylcobinamide-GDP ribazoletransferase [Croceicoccus naphthovorans]AKM09983.1 cobalamin synthase [Croceicoccus naphthovorans]MBB3991148.1 adenosylcobinamide-GDP ribazoletransferase [Croceicoccus naphthovorans]
MKSLVIAFQFMTRIPLPAVSANTHDAGAAMRWFPVTGAVIGAVVWGAAFAGQSVEPLLAALLGVAAWAAITGSLHLDGLADVADAAGASHKDPTRLSAVMADPHVGSFGVVAITMQLVAKLILLSLIAERGGLWVLPAICCAARIGPLAWALLLPPLHKGMGTMFAAATGWHHLAIWSVLAAAMAWYLPSLVVAIPAIGAWALWCRSRLGGISGDSHGAGIEIVETTLLLAWVAMS